MKAAALSDYAQDHSIEMVQWFIRESKAPMKMTERQVGAHRYFLCVSGLTENGNFVPVAGRGATKFDAAVRCIGEFLERKAVFEFFRSDRGSVPTSAISMDNSGVIHISDRKTQETPLLAREFRTTNGWAVHTSESQAQERAYLEAIERHLLVSSFLRWGSRGFIDLGEIQIDDLCVQSTLSRYKTGSMSAGFAIAKKNGESGLSFGHFAESSWKITNSPSWTHALYEAVDKLAIDFDASASQDPIAQDVDWYLHSELSLTVAPADTEQETLPLGPVRLFSQDLGKLWNLPFPLYSAFVFGAQLMPLFVPRMLSYEGGQYILSQGRKLGFSASIPERIPVQ